MSEKLIQLRQELVENPYVTFDSDGKGVSRVFDAKWDFHALNQNVKTVSFRHIGEKYRLDIQSYLYALMQWQKKKSNSNSHTAVSSLANTRNRLNTIATRWGKSDFSLLSSEREWKKCTKALHGVGGVGMCQHIASTINALNKVGGAGTMQDFVDVFQQSQVDGALAASVFHKNVIDIGELKQFLIDNNVAARLCN